jgi:hypothetical protein
MYEILFFDSDQEIEKAVLENFLNQTVNLRNFYWTNDFYTFVIDNEIDATQTYISLQTSEVGFRFHYAVFSHQTAGFSIKKRIDILKKLSAKTSISLLSTDDELNPWARVLIEPEGLASTVETDDDSLCIVDYYNHPFGDFRTREELTGFELDALKQTMAKTYPNISINYALDGPVINGSFNEARHRFNQLAMFEHHYGIVPLGKNEWLSKDDKSELFVALMTEFHLQTGYSLCLFPRNYSEIKTIEGGSDSEEYCLILSENKMEKVVYKQRRVSWNR